MDKHIRSVFRVVMNKLMALISGRALAGFAYQERWHTSLPAYANKEALKPPTKLVTINLRLIKNHCTPLTIVLPRVLTFAIFSLTPHLLREFKKKLFQLSKILLNK